MNKAFPATLLILSVMMVSCVSTKPTNGTIFKTDRHTEFFEELTDPVYIKACYQTNEAMQARLSSFNRAV